MAVNSFNAQNPPVTTKGDVFTFSTIPTRLGVGANDTVLTADSSTATGLKWAAVSAGGMTEIASTTLNNSASTYTYSSLGSYKHIIMIGQGLQGAGSSAESINVQFNSDTGSNYSSAGIGNSNSTGNFPAFQGTTYLRMATLVLATTTDTSDTFGDFITFFMDYGGSGRKSSQTICGSFAGGQARAFSSYGLWTSTNAITSITILTSASNNFKAGVIKLYGVN